MMVSALLQTRTASLLAVFVCLWTLAVSIAVIPNSQCVDECDNNSPKTTADDLVCPDAAYDTTGNGVAMKNCLLCQSTGTAYINPTRNDIYTFLYNQKYTLQTCLFDRSGETSISGCEDPCLPLKPVLEEEWYKSGPSEGFTPLYDYCSINGGAFGTYAEKCSSCLKGKDGTIILGNFMDTLDSACQNKPNATLGQTVSLREPLFVTTSTSTSAGATPTDSSSSVAQSEPGSGSKADPTSPSAPQPLSPTSDDTSNSGLSTGAKAGIGVGVGIGGLLVIAAAWIFYSRKKKQVKGRDGYVAPWPQDRKYPITQDYGPPPPPSEPETSYASPIQSEPVEVEWQQRRRVELPT